MASSIFSLKPGEWSRDCSKGIRNSFGFYVENGYPKHLPCERDNGNSKRFLREVPQRLTGDPNYRYLSFCILLTLSQARLSVWFSLANPTEYAGDKAAMSWGKQPLGPVDLSAAWGKAWTSLFLDPHLRVWRRSSHCKGLSQSRRGTCGLQYVPRGVWAFLIF